MRDLTLRGVTTDGSSLDPEPLREVFGDVPHQLCEFHVLAEVVKAVVGAVASERKGLGVKQPKSLNLSQFVEDQNGPSL